MISSQIKVINNNKHFHMYAMYVMQCMLLHEKLTTLISSAIGYIYFN